MDASLLGRSALALEHPIDTVGISVRSSIPIGRPVDL